MVRQRVVQNPHTHRGNVHFILSPACFCKTEHILLTSVTQACVKLPGRQEAHGEQSKTAGDPC